MREKAIVEILLVRSVEESLPNFFSPETLLKATTEAGSIENKQEWLRKRAMYLFSQIPQGLKEITSITQPRAKLLIALTIIAFLVGLSSNFLGPSDHFHIIYNPIVILSVWNILIFIFIILSMISKLKNFPKKSKPNSQSILPQKTDSDGPANVSNFPSNKTQQTRMSIRHKLLSRLISYKIQKTRKGVLHNLLSILWLYWNQFMIRFQRDNELLSSCPSILSKFWDYYLRLCSPIVFAVNAK